MAAPIAGLARFEGFEGFERFEGLKRLKRLKGLEGASGSFGPVEKERLGLPRPLVLHPLGLPQPLTQPLIWQLWPVSKSSKGLQDLAGASGSFGPVEPLVWQQQQQFGTRKGTTAASFAPTWLATASNLAALARFEEFEGFAGFGRSSREFRASRNRKTWLATAALSQEKEPISLPQPRYWQLQELAWQILKGLTRLKPLVWLEKERLGLPQPLVWQHNSRFGTFRGV